jgi:hypothetical protein
MSNQKYGLCDCGVMMSCTNLKTMFPALLQDTQLRQRKRETEGDKGMDRERLQMDRERGL